MCSVLIFLCFLSFGQALQWSNPVKLKGSAVFTKVIGENTQGIYLLRYRNRFYSKNVIIERYDHQLSMQKSKTIELKNARLVKIYMMHRGLLIIKSKYNRLSDQNDLMAQWYSFALEQTVDEKLLVSTDVKEFGDRGNYRLKISDDQKHIALIYTEEIKNQIVIHHKLLDDSLNVLFTNDFLLPYEHENFILQDFLVTNDKTTHLLAKTISKKKRKVMKSHSYLYQIDGNDIRDKPIPDSIELKATKLVYDRPNDNAIVTCLYGIPDKFGLEGSAFIRFGDSAFVDVSLGPFSELVVDDIKVNNRNHGAISEGFGIVQAVPRNDGGMLIIAEQQDVATEDDIVLVNGIPQSTSKNIYNFNEVLILNYDNEGFLDWYKVVTKNQTTVNDGGYFSSIAVFVGANHIQLLYNDQLRTSGDVMQYTVYNNGENQSKKLLKTSLDVVAIIPTESRQVSSNKIIIPTAKNRRFALLKLIYN